MVWLQRLIPNTTTRSIQQLIKQCTLTSVTCGQYWNPPYFFQINRTSNSMKNKTSVLTLLCGFQMANIWSCTIYNSVGENIVTLLLTTYIMAIWYSRLIDRLTIIMCASAGCARLWHSRLSLPGSPINTVSLHAPYHELRSPSCHFSVSDFLHILSHLLLFATLFTCDLFLVVFSFVVAGDLCKFDELFQGDPPSLVLLRQV